MKSEDTSWNVNDVMAEETSRGRKQPKKAVALARERMIRYLSRTLENPNYSRDDYVDAIRLFGLKDESAEFRMLLDLWRKRRGGGK